MENDQETIPARGSPWAFVGLGGLVLVVLAVGIANSALAEDLGALFRLRQAQVLSPDRDPIEFLSAFDRVPPRPVVVLNRDDAVAFELLRLTRTMAETDVLRTAKALCEEAGALGWDPLLFVAVIHIESFYDPYAVSPKGAEGLMQLMPHTAAWMAERLSLDRSDGHSFDPELNVRLGTRYLAMLAREFGHMDRALTAYNRGPRATRHLLASHGELPRDIRDFYASKVLRHYQQLRYKYANLPS
jgi:soluble lytic murein transglycosylase-like protein